MSAKLKRLCRYTIYAILTNAIYGLILYFLTTWLAGFSLLYAYLGNLALIIWGLMMDEYVYKMYQSKKLVRQIKREKDADTNYRIILWLIDSTVSFKAVLYLFYICIVIAAQIIDFYPSAVSENLGNFVFSIRYSILILMAFDMLIGQFVNDRKRMKKISAIFKANFSEHQD